MRREEIDSFSAAVIPRARLRSLGFHDLDHVERSLESITRLLHRIGPEKGFLTLLLESAAVSADPDLSLTQFEGLLDRHPDPFGFCHQLLEGGRMSSLTYLLGAAPAWPVGLRVIRTDSVPVSRLAATESLRWCAQ